MWILDTHQPKARQEKSATKQKQEILVHKQQISLKVPSLSAYFPLSRVVVEVGALEHETNVNQQRRWGKESHRHPPNRHNMNVLVGLAKQSTSLD